MNNLNWASLPDVIGKKIFMKAAEQEYLELYKPNSPWQLLDGNFWIGKWMEILYKFGQVQGFPFRRARPQRFSYIVRYAH